MAQSEILKTLSPDGVAPKKRVSNAADEQRLFSLLIDRNQIRSSINAKVAGAIDGNPPQNQAKLDAAGMGWVTNVNHRLLEGDINQSTVPDYMLFADVPEYVCVRVNPPKYTKMECLKMGQIISEEMTALFNEWDCFDFQMQLSIKNRRTYGLGPLYFPHKEDFRFEAAPQGTVYVDEETTQDMSKLPFVFIYYEWSLTDLYDEIADQDGDSSTNWDVAVVKKILTDACNSYAGLAQTRQWEYWQNKFRDHDTWFTTIDAKVKSAWSFVREFDGTITRSLVVADASTGNGKYLYRKEGEYDSWSQIIHPMFLEIGNGHWYGSKGLGIKAFNARDAQNRLKNRLVDAAFVGAQIILQAKDESALDAFQIGQMGPYQIINSELNPLQVPMASVLDKPMAVDRMLDYDLRGNIGNLRQKMGDPNSVQPVSAQEAQIQAAYSNQLTLAEETMLLRQFDKLYRELFNRIKDKPRAKTEQYPHEDWEAMVDSFHERCSKRGVPSVAFKHVKSVKAYRNIGRGSEYIKQQTAGQVYGIVRNDPNVPQNVTIKALRSYLASLTGREALDMIWEDEDLEMMPTEDASKAQDENGIMLIGVPALWTPDQNNLAHLQTHLPFIAEKLQAASQGQLPPEAFITFAQIALQHVAQTLDAMQGERKSGSTYQQLFNAYQQLVSEVKAFIQRFQQQQQAQQEQAQMAQAQQQQAILTGQMLDPESQVQMARVKADAQIKMLETQNDIARKNAKTQADIQSKGLKTRQDLLVKASTTAQDINLKQKQANAPQKAKSK